MKPTIRRVLGVAMVLLTSVPGFAQTQFHVFPQFADGKASDGTYYRSTLTVLPWSGGTPPT